MTNAFPHRNRFGVTLIEAIMVITLLAAATMASSFVFRSDWVARRGVTDVTNDVAETLLAARNTAVRNQASVRVRRTNFGGVEQLWIVEQAGPIRPGKTWLVDLGEQVKLSGSPIEIVFASAGTADRELEWQVSQGSVSGEIGVSPTSGKVTRILP